jgi:hypothetical protein
MKLLLLSLLICFSTTAFSKELELKFTYKSYDGQLTYSCDHKLTNELTKFYDIYCFDDANNLKKKFFAIVRVSKYTRPRLPRNSYEITYRISQRDAVRGPQHVGTTNWMHFNNETDLATMTLSQAVENDIAGLYLDISL